MKGMVERMHGTTSGGTGFDATRLARIDAFLNERYVASGLLPHAQILIARDGAGSVLGCVALRPWSQPGVCEIKRLYVRPAARGQALGRRLAEAVIAWASRAGYVRVQLDTLASMQAARQLYAALGFRPVAPYYDNPVPDTLYMALELEPGEA